MAESESVAASEDVKVKIENKMEDDTVVSVDPPTPAGRAHGHDIAKLSFIPGSEYIVRWHGTDFIGYSNMPLVEQDLDLSLGNRDSLFGFLVAADPLVDKFTTANGAKLDVAVPYDRKIRGDGLMEESALHTLRDFLNVVFQVCDFREDPIAPFSEGPVTSGARVLMTSADPSDPHADRLAGKSVLQTGMPYIPRRTDVYGTNRTVINAMERALVVHERLYQRFELYDGFGDLENLIANYPLRVKNTLRYRMNMIITPKHNADGKRHKLEGMQVVTQASHVQGWLNHSSLCLFMHNMVPDELVAYHVERVLPVGFNVSVPDDMKVRWRIAFLPSASELRYDMMFRRIMLPLSAVRERILKVMHSPRAVSYAAAFAVRSEYTDSLSKLDQNLMERTTEISTPVKTVAALFRGYSNETLQVLMTALSHSRNVYLKLQYPPVAPSKTSLAELMPVMFRAFGNFITICSFPPEIFTVKREYLTSAGDRSRSVLMCVETRRAFNYLMKVCTRFFSNHWTGTARVAGPPIEASNYAVAKYYSTYQGYSESADTVFDISDETLGEVSNVMIHIYPQGTYLACIHNIVHYLSLTVAHHRILPDTPWAKDPVSETFFPHLPRNQFLHTLSRYTDEKLGRTSSVMGEIYAGLKSAMLDLLHMMEAAGGKGKSTRFAATFTSIFDALPNPDCLLMEQIQSHAHLLALSNPDSVDCWFSDADAARVWTSTGFVDQPRYHMLPAKCFELAQALGFVENVVGRIAPVPDGAAPAIARMPHWGVAVGDVALTALGRRDFGIVRNWRAPCNDAILFSVDSVPEIEYATVAVTRPIETNDASLQSDCGLSDPDPVDFVALIKERLVSTDRFEVGIDGPHIAAFLTNGSKIKAESVSPDYDGVLVDLLTKSKYACERGACVSLAHRQGNLAQRNLFPDIYMTQQFARVVTFSKSQVGDVFITWLTLAQKILKVSIAEFSDFASEDWRASVGASWGLTFNIKDALLNEPVQAVPALMDPSSSEIFRQMLAVANTALRTLYKPTVQFFAYSRRRWYVMDPLESLHCGPFANNRTERTVNPLTDFILVYGNKHPNENQPVFMLVRNDDAQIITIHEHSANQTRAVHAMTGSSLVLYASRDVWCMGSKTLRRQLLDYIRDTDSWVIFDIEARVAPPNVVSPAAPAKDIKFMEDACGKIENDLIAMLPFDIPTLPNAYVEAASLNSEYRNKVPVNVRFSLQPYTYFKWHGENTLERILSAFGIRAGTLANPGDTFVFQNVRNDALNSGVASSDLAAKFSNYLNFPSRRYNGLSNVRDLTRDMLAHRSQLADVLTLLSKTAYDDSQALFRVTVGK